MSYLVSCNGCAASAVIEGGRPNDQLSCNCCTVDHSHQDAADTCPGAGDLPGHAEACAPGVSGCTVCRPVTVSYLGTVEMRPLWLT